MAFNAHNLAIFMQNQNNALLDYMWRKEIGLTPRNCSRVEYNAHSGDDEFVTYDENGYIVSRETIYPGESFNGWTV